MQHRAIPEDLILVLAQKSSAFPALSPQQAQGNHYGWNAKPCTWPLNEFPWVTMRPRDYFRVPRHAVGRGREPLRRQLAMGLPALLMLLASHLLMGSGEGGGVPFCCAATAGAAGRRLRAWCLNAMHSCCSAAASVRACHDTEVMTHSVVGVARFESVCMRGQNREAAWKMLHPFALQRLPSTACSINGSFLGTIASAAQSTGVPDK